MLKEIPASFIQSCLLTNISILSHNYIINIKKNHSSLDSIKYALIEAKQIAV